MGSTAKTNAIRLLERVGVTFAVREYEVDLGDLAPDDYIRVTSARVVPIAKDKD